MSEEARWVEQKISGSASPDLPKIPDGPPLLVVLSGPSGSGKDAVRDLLMAWDLPMHFVVTATTRLKRPGEVPGVDYLFVSEAEFDRLECEGELIEHALVYGQRRGVPRAQVMEPMATGHDVIARVDVQGAATLKDLIANAVLIFIAPPSFAEERRRLIARGTEDEEQLRLRSETASQEMEAAASFDYVLVNETGALEATARQVVDIIVHRKSQGASR